MSSKIKTLSLAFVAIGVMSMAVAGSAQASQVHATNAQQAVIHGQQLTQHVFTTTAGTVTCTQATFEGTAPPTTADELTVTATYTGCTAFGQAAVIDMNGCKFTLTSTDTSNPPVTFANKTVNVDITGCTSGKHIDITTGICRMTVKPQQHLSHILFTNNPAGQPKHDVTANITVEKIAYESDGPLCPHMPAGTKETNGQYTGTGTFQAHPITASTSVTKHGHQYVEHTKGAALGLEVT